MPPSRFSDKLLKRRVKTALLNFSSIHVSVSQHSAPCLHALFVNFALPQFTLVNPVWPTRNRLPNKMRQILRLLQTWQMSAVSHPLIFSIRNEACHLLNQFWRCRLVVLTSNAENRHVNLCGLTGQISVPNGCTCADVSVQRCSAQKIPISCNCFWPFCLKAR